MRHAFVAVCLLALAACGETETAVTVAMSGSVTPVGQASVEGASLTLYGAKDLVMGEPPVALGHAAVAADGGWAVGSIEVSSVSDAVVAVGVGTDSLFPTLSGVVDYSQGQSKADLSTARLFIVPRSVATAVTAAIGQPALLERGFVMGLVTDGTRPLAGATVTAGGSLALDVYYPSADLTSVSKTETSASGLFVVAADPALLFLDLAAHKTGHAFAPTIAPLKSGLCSFAVVLPETASATARVDVSGVVTAIGAGPSGSAGASVELLAPYDVASSGSSGALDGGGGTVADRGRFAVSQVDVTNVSQGLLARVSGAGLYPTVSGVTAWASEADADKVGTTKAHLFVVSSALAQDLASAVGSSTLLTDGFVMGLVTDGTSPVAGATVARTDGKALTVLYPNSTFTRLDGTSTSASGVFLVAPEQRVALVTVTAVKAGWTFTPTTLLQPAGACFFAALVPAAHAPITVDVSGLVSPIGASSPAGATLTVLSPYDFLTSATLTPLAHGTVSATSTFSLTGVPVTNVATALLAEVADDGTALYPTVSGLTAWASEADADKKGTSTAHVFAVPRALASGLSAGLSMPTLLADGFVLGLVTNGTTGVSGATIARADGKPLAVLYPSPTFAAFSGTSTSASGLFLIPATGGLSQVAIVASQGGATFGPAVLMPRAGVCFFPVLRP